MVSTVAPPPMQPTVVPAVVPMLDERQGAFVERADRALAKSIPDRYARMTAIAQAWGQSANEAKLQQRAKEALASAVDTTPDKLGDHFVTRCNRPIFPEHETTDSAGNVQRYDRAALQAIVDRCNRRILDTGDLAAMSAGHTPTPEQQTSGRPMPDMVGFCGPFRLGLIGQDAPRWAILADEHVFRDEAARVQKMPRRSPEVWMEPRMADRVLDPIAVLGAETPRLDTGIGRFSSRHGKLNPTRYTVARYSMGSVASGTNTFTEKYSDAGDSMDDATIQGLVQAVLQGLSATPQWQWITDQMQTDQNPMPSDQDQGPPATADAAPGASPDVPGMPAPGGAGMPGAAPTDAGASATATPDASGAPMPDASTSPTDQGGGNPAPADAGAGAAPDSGAGDSGATPEELAQMGDDEKQEYSRLSPTHQYGYMKARRRHVKPGGTMQYASTVERDRYARVERDLKNAQAELFAVRRERTVATRYSRLAELANEFDLDPAAEQQETAAFTDEQFDRHCTVTVAKYSRRDPMGGMPTLPLKPLYTVTEPSAEEKRVERYSKLAVKLATESNGTMTWEQAVDKAKEQIARA